MCTAVDWIQNEHYTTGLNIDYGEIAGMKQKESHDP